MHRIPTSNSASNSSHFQSMEDRLTKDDNIARELGQHPDLVDFLQTVTNYLANNSTEAMPVAHFLMGKADQLPAGLNPPKNTLTLRQKEILYDVLRTNRYGSLGIREADQKTIDKLTRLRELLKDKATATSSASIAPQSSPTKSTLTERFLLSLRETPVTTVLSNTQAQQAAPPNAPQSLSAASTTPAEKTAARQKKVKELLSRAPLELTSHPNWQIVEQNMENYLKLSEKIQGASFDRLLDEFGNQIFDLLKTAKIQSTLSDDKALAMATVRDWMNIKMSCPSEVENEDSIGCKKSLARTGDPDVISPGNQLSFCIKTPIICDDGSARQVEVLSCIGPALDTHKQPEFKNFVDGEKPSDYVLKIDAYKQSLNTIKAQIIETARSKKPPRVVLSAIGTNAFLSALPPNQRKIALGMISTMLAEVARELHAQNIPVVFTDLDKKFCEQINEQNRNKAKIHVEGAIPGNWIKDGDLILNAWDSNSLLGNGLAKDNSIDGFIGRSSLIHFMHALLCSMFNAKVIGTDGKPTSAPQTNAPPSSAITA
ncbi:MAG: hypothetical protein RL618_1981 [Pseudomonadota bacterium]